MSTFTRGGTTITPRIVTGYKSSRQSGNIVHTIIGTNVPDVTYAPASLRTGTLEMVFANLGEARAAEVFFCNSGSFTFSDFDQPTANMVFAVVGAVECELESETRELGLVRVGFQEVS